MIDRSDKQWYRDAIIYQLHVKSFFDSDNDGVGDFAGLTDKLDYVKDLGVSAIWVMPFYPSPLRDDGYDIAQYRGINPAFGSMRDFRRFVREAHDRDLRVITELVINHTSDQHPWFQKARKARADSPARDFYVWSDTDPKYQDARIIFIDAETSNWTWDPVAKAYYWHRFYSHQPDLNFDNPRVLSAVLDTMRFWLDSGVDGLRLDAIPYLIERDGTNCENLPETHEVIKKIRAALDARYPDRMLLAEANQWPEETAQYFGKGDECHMAFHFPLMPRIYIALAREDRNPVTDIMRQTPEIPEGAQWAIFLRNHDELTLEMVTSRERDYLWEFYAREGRARLNLGIRRRLAPLLENDRRKIELLNSLLFSMPGTPVFYYGDEIGMGDNIYLGDRDGVRTPMQWSPDRNGGFSRADPARLFLPAIQDPIYGFASVNVEAQLASPSSLLNWTRRMIAVRRRYRALGRGSLRFLYPANRKVLAYLREHESETLLCVANVSRAPQAVEIDLAEFRGAAPIELTAGTVFPQIGGLPYLLTLAGYGFYWFKLDTSAAQQERFGPAPLPELFTLVLTGATEGMLSGRELAAFERTIAPRFLAARRWFAGKSAGIRHVSALGWSSLFAEEPRLTLLWLVLDVELRDGARQFYSTPLAVDEQSEEDANSAYTIARVRRGAKMGVVFDADAAPAFAANVVESMRRQASLPFGAGGVMRFERTSLLESEAPVAKGDIKRIGAEQSNTSIAVGERMILKIYRRLEPGRNPEIEVGRFLTEEARFKNSPELFGWASLETGGEEMGLALLQRFVRNQGDAWSWSLDALKRGLETLDLIKEGGGASMEQAFADYLTLVDRLGQRTAELHLALATPTDDPAFASEPMRQEDVEAVASDAARYAERAFAALELAGERAEEADRRAIAALQQARAQCNSLIEKLRRIPPAGAKTRVHGDYHLGQVLVAQSDVVIVDFEGEPSRTLDERLAKASPLRDVAGMLRSFDYAADEGARDVVKRLAHDPHQTEESARAWRDLVSRRFLAAYEPIARSGPGFVEDETIRRGLLRLHLLAKALYEIDYEANNRPDRISTPVRGVLELLAQSGENP